MRHRRTGTVIGVMAALVALTPVGADAKPSKPAQVSVQEKACKETLYERGAFRSVIDPLVPDRFELQPFDPPASPNAPPYAGPDRVRLFVTEYTCDSAVTTSGARQRSQRDVATIIVSAALTSISGQPADGPYVLAWATDNAVLNDRLNNIGWTSDLLDRASGLTDVMVSPGPPPGDLTQVTQRFVGAGWDHTLVSATSSPSPRSRMERPRSTATPRRALSPCASPTPACRRLPESSPAT